MDKDIQEMFRKKNREILIKNLELDIERNIDVGHDALVNIFDYQFDIGIRNLSSMYEGDLSLSKVEKIVLPFKNQLFLELEEEIQKKKQSLLEQVSKLEFTEKEMQEYYKFVFQTSHELELFFESECVSNLLKQVLTSFQKLSKTYFKEDREAQIFSRVNDYVHYRLVDKLKKLVNSEFLIRDNNLANKGKESYERFQELESKTTFC